MAGVYEVRAVPEMSEADGDVYYVTAENPEAAAHAVQAQVGNEWIVEASSVPISDERAQQLGLTDGKPKIG